jgi:hypothetical protein
VEYRVTRVRVNTGSIATNIKKVRVLKLIEFVTKNKYSAQKIRKKAVYRDREVNIK